MTETPKQAHPLASVGGLIAAAGGWAFAQYTGASGWIPLGAVLVLMVIFAKTPLRPAAFVGAIIITLAHVVWFIVAGAVGGVWQVVFLDIVVLSLLTAALWMRPGAITASLLGAVQVLSLAYNVYLISQEPFGNPVHRALTAHIVLRAIAVVALIAGYVSFRKQSLPPAPAEAASL